MKAPFIPGKQVFLNDLSSVESLIKSFWDKEEGDSWGFHEYAGELEDIEWIFATTSYRDYSGDAFVLFKRNGKLWEVNGGHCSCYGFEGQWSPEETTVASLSDRLNHKEFGMYSSYGDTPENEFANELRQFLSEIDASQTPQEPVA